MLDQTLASTSSPKEIAALTFELDQLAEGQYRSAGVARARELLGEMAGQQPADVDVAPLFEVLHYYGDASVVAELEKASGQWTYYAVAALAALPDNAGLQSLVRMADPQGSSGNRLQALEMLAQLAASNPMAQEALLNQIVQRQIPPELWPHLRDPLIGNAYYPAEGMITPYPTVESWSDIKITHIRVGNQNFYHLPTDESWTADGLQARLAMVATLQGATQEPAAVQVLTQVQAQLQGRLNQLAEAVPGFGD